uniref:Actin-related protein 6 n=2 Tax=Prymnesium polylepis TaxID=72548 RepID=A0A7S4NCX7_9EUKA
MQYRLSIERGCVVNWDTQTEVWARAFGSDVLNIHPADCSLLLTEAPMCPPSIQDTVDEMVFEHFGFQSYCTRTAPVLAALKAQTESEQPANCTLVLDAGFSSTHTVPIFGGTPLNFATRRLNVGGKLLTNQLKTIISYRSFNVMEETRLVTDVKERLCYVSLNFSVELSTTQFKGKKNTVRREFVMPDFVTNVRGHIRDPNEPMKACGPSAEMHEGVPPKKKHKEGASDEQVLKLSNERITVPELLHHPSDIGIEQAGVAECLAQSLEACVPDVRDALCSNIVLTGGTTLLPNFEERLRRELREILPSELAVNVTHVSDPLLAAWFGGSIFAASDTYESQVVTKEEYSEYGHSLCRRRFMA